jgi:uncharacterized repeat protein (TIGR01451 family)
VANPGESAAFLSPNRQQGYSTVLRQAGIEIFPSTPPASWRLGLSITGYGYDSDVRPVKAAEPHARNERVEYHRGALTEWYVNRPGGLEQGFELREPRGRPSGPLVIAMAVQGDLEARAGVGDAVSFAARSGETLIRYAGLKAWDADGRPLSSRMEAADQEVRLVIEAQTARFPVTVDPVFVHQAQLLGHGDPMPPADAEFGASVSVSGDTVVVGSPLDHTSAGLEAGSAYVFVRSGSTWTEQQKLQASDGAPNHDFGLSVSVSGDTAVLGAPFQNLSAGTAYVFVRAGSTWTEQQKLLASDGTAFDNVGYSVSVSGDTAVLGARGDDTPGGGDAGSAFVFVRAGTTWTEQQKLLAPDGAAADLFGSAVSVSGDTAVVGALLDDNAGGFDAGSAYVFVRSGAAWTLQQKLLASDGASADHLGISVSLSGETAVVGASGDDLPGAGEAGSAYVFVRSGTTWTEQQKLVTSDGATGDVFGYSVCISGETVVAGARFDDIGGAVDAGSAYVFIRSGTTWSEQQKLLASVSGAAFDLFGGSVSVSGDTVVIGAERDDTPAGTDAGAAYVFVRSGTTWSEQQKLVPADGAAGDAFGSSVSISGDTVVVGAAGDDEPGALEAGSVYVFVRSGTTWTQQQKLLASDGAQLDRFGSAVALSGDTVVVGSPFDDNTGGVDAGSAYVFVRSGTTWTEEQKLLPSDGAANDSFGLSVSAAGDTVVAGMPNDFNAGGVQAGSAYVFVRSGTIWSEQQKLLASDGASSDHFGVSVSVSGDTVIAGANDDDNPGGTNAGSAYVFVRSGTIWTEQQKLLPSDGASSDAFGRAVSVSGDTVAVAAYFDDTPGGLEAGSAYVFVRSGTTWSEQPKLLAPDGAANDHFGTAVSVSGDTVVVGAPSDDTPANGPDAGSAHVFQLQLQADLGVTKTDGQTTAVPGQPVTYTIVVSNAGPDPVVGATVTDVVPAALLAATWTCVATLGSSCTAGGSGSINDIVNLLAGGTATYTLTGTVDPAATGTLVNTATVAASASPPDPNPANNTATDVDALTPQADLALTKTGSPDPVPPGGVLTYILTVANAGPSDATSVTLVDSLPTGVTFASSVPGPPACTLAGATVTCDLGTLPAGANAVVTIDVTVNAGAGVLVNTANVSSSGADPDPADNSASATTTVRGAKGELTHGTVALHDLATQPGPFADLDVFLISQKPYSSYEVVVDATSGDIGAGAGPLVQRIGPDGTTVLQDSSPIGTGSSRSLRWRNTTAADVDDQTVRVRSAGCGTDCGPDDVYRIRAYETTYSVPRFNNAGSQLTVLVLQNPTNYPISGDVYLQDTSGTVVATEPFSLTPKQTLVLNTAAIPGATGVGGALTIAHDGRYGELTGKTVALEPATGFSFDSALEVRPK